MLQIVLIDLTLLSLASNTLQQKSLVSKTEIAKGGFNGTPGTYLDPPLLTKLRHDLHFHVVVYKIMPNFGRLYRNEYAVEQPQF